MKVTTRYFPIPNFEESWEFNALQEFISIEFFYGIWFEEELND